MPIVEQFIHFPPLVVAYLRAAINGIASNVVIIAAVLRRGRQRHQQHQQGDKGFRFHVFRCFSICKITTFLGFYTIYDEKKPKSVQILTFQGNFFLPPPGGGGVEWVDWKAQWTVMQ